MEEEKRKENRTAEQGLTAEAADRGLGVVNQGQGFSAVSAEAMKFLESSEEKKEDEGERQEFILTRDTLAKRPAEFGPTKELPKKREGINKKLVFGLLGAIGVLFVVVIGVLVAVGVQNNREVSLETGNSNEEKDSKSALPSGVVPTLVVGEPLSYNAVYIVDGTIVTITGEGVFESAKNGEVVFAVVNGGKLQINGKIKIRKTGEGEVSEDELKKYDVYGMNSAIVVVGEGSEVSIDGATIEVDAPGAYGVVAVENWNTKLNNTTITVQGGGVSGLAERFGGKIELGGNVTINGGSSNDGGGNDGGVEN